MILGASMEFERGHSSEVVERPSDNEEIPMVSDVRFACRHSYPVDISS